MHTSEHVKRSMEAIGNDEFYLQNKEIIDKLLTELHEWMDQYQNTHGDGYDYTGLNVMKHRERLHHMQGAHRVADHFAELYGKEYHDLAFQEACRHITDDMGEVPDETLYRQIGIWKELRGF